MNESQADHRHAHPHAHADDSHAVHHGHSPAAAHPTTVQAGHPRSPSLRPAATAEPAIYTCPMHPEIRRPGPGNCPICGMALEPVDATLDEENIELARMTRRFWMSVALTLPIALLAMTEFVPALHERVAQLTGPWFARIQFALATPVVLWGGWPFFVLGWRSLVLRSLNMFTLIALGVGVAYAFSVVGFLAPGWLPAAFKVGGNAPLYFEAAAVITTLVLLGQVLELRARSQTSTARQGAAAAGAADRAAARDGWHRARRAA